MNPITRKPSIEQLEDRINLDTQIQFFNLGNLVQSGGRFGTVNLGYFNQGEILTLKSDIPPTSWAGGGVATGLNIYMNNTVALDLLNWIQDIGRYTVISSGNISLSYGITRGMYAPEEAYGSISLIGKKPPANLKTNVPIKNPDGSITYSYQVEGIPGSQIYYRGNVSLELYYAVGPNRSDIREIIASNNLESNPGGTISFTVPKEVVQNSNLKEPRSHIIAIIDKDNLAAESNETDLDNIKSIANANLVALPPQISANGNVKVGYRIDGGPIQTEIINIWLYWSDSKTWEGDHLFIKKIPINPKAIGDQWIDNALKKSQLDSAPSGKPYLLTRLDPLGVYVESNESDNTAVLVLPDINLKDSQVLWNEKALVVSPKFENLSLIPENTTATISAYWAKGPKKTDIIDQSMPLKSFPLNSKTLQLLFTEMSTRPDQTSHVVFVADFNDSLKELNEGNNIKWVALKSGALEITNVSTKETLKDGSVIDFATRDIRKSKTLQFNLKNTGTPDTLMEIRIEILNPIQKGSFILGKLPVFSVISVNGKKPEHGKRIDEDPTEIKLKISGGKNIRIKLKFTAPTPDDQLISGPVLEQDLYGNQNGHLIIQDLKKELAKIFDINLKANIRKPVLKVDWTKFVEAAHNDFGVGYKSPNLIIQYKSSSGNIKDFYYHAPWNTAEPFVVVEQLKNIPIGVYGDGSLNRPEIYVKTFGDLEHPGRTIDGHGLNFDSRMLGTTPGKIYVIDWNSGKDGLYRVKEKNLEESQLITRQRVKYSSNFEYSKAKFDGVKLLENGYNPEWHDLNIDILYTRKISKEGSTWFYSIKAEKFNASGSIVEKMESKTKIENMRSDILRYYRSSISASLFNPANGKVFFNGNTGDFQTDLSYDSYINPKAPNLNEVLVEFGNTSDELHASLKSSNSKNVVLSVDSTSPLQTGAVYYKKNSDINWSVKSDFAPGSSEFQIGSLSKKTPYQFKVTGVLEDGTSITSDILDVQTEVDQPKFPQDLATSRILKDAVFIKWTDSSNDETGFLITQSSDNGKTWDDIDLISKNKTTFQVTDLTPSTEYQFRVFAVNGEVNSDPSRTLKVKTLKDIPKTPENLHFSEIRNNSVVVRWDDKSSDETGFRIAKSSDGGHTWNTLPNLAPNSEKFQVTGLIANRKYQFKVQALGANDSSPYTASESVQTDLNPPKAPTNLRVDSPNYNRLNLRWKDNSNDEGQFEISMSSDGGTAWKTIDYVKMNKTSYLVNNLDEETSYQFRIRSIGDGSQSVWSEIAKGTTTSSKPDIPTELKASDIDLNSFKLTWKTAKGAISRYEVQILGDEGWQPSENVGKNFTSAKIEFERRGGSKLKPDTQYQVRLVAVSENGRSSDATNPIFVRTDSTVPAAPESIKVSSVTAKSSSVSWSSTSKYVDHFEVYVESGGTWQLSENVNKDFRSAKIEYELAKKIYLKPETDYKVRVRAIGLAPSMDASPWSEVMPVKTQSLRPSVPEGLKLGTVSSNKFEISWKHSGDKLNKFQVQVQTDGVWHISEDVGTSFRSALIEYEVANGASIQPNKTYNVRIRAVNKDGNDFINSDWSESISVTTESNIPETPNSVSVSNIGLNSFDLSWKSNGKNVSKFEVWILTGGKWNKSEAVPSARRSAQIQYEISGGSRLQQDTLYSVKIIAINDDTTNPSKSDFSQFVDFKTTTLKPHSPSGLKATVINKTSFVITWNDNDGIKSDRNETKFEVHISKNGVNFYHSENVPKDTEKATIEYEVTYDPKNIKKIKANTKYWVIIYAVNGSGKTLMTGNPLILTTDK